MIGDNFDQNNAFNITKYASDRWRLAGNQGFNETVMKIRDELETAGYKNDTSARLSYRIESYPLRTPAWNPRSARLVISGESDPLLDFSTNRNMIAINSFPVSQLEREVIFIETCDAEELINLDVKGKIVMGECHPYSLYKLAVEQGGAVGILSYRMPAYNQPEKFVHSISFASIPFNATKKSWGICLSYYAKEKLRKKLINGDLKVQVSIDSEFTPDDELTIIAEIKGSKQPHDRFVYSAHIQEPGANDNASGVGALTEMAKTAARLVNNQSLDPHRSITFLWGDEIRSTRRYIQQDSTRATGIKWGMSLDMVGEDTKKTGGTFLIEKMPDPSAIWTRGKDKHTEWGAGHVDTADFNPHYFNDLVESICREQAHRKKWIVRTNPFEGGSDHQPFLDAGIPGLLLWHFTDVFYHTDADRIDKVSPNTLANVGTAALTCSAYLSSASEDPLDDLLVLVSKAAKKRIKIESKLSRKNIRSKKTNLSDELKILTAWKFWYTGAIKKTNELPLPIVKSEQQRRINLTLSDFENYYNKQIKKIK